MYILLSPINIQNTFCDLEKTIEILKKRKRNRFQKDGRNIVKVKEQKMLLGLKKLSVYNFRNIGVY